MAMTADDKVMRRIRLMIKFGVERSSPQIQQSVSSSNDSRNTARLHHTPCFHLRHKALRSRLGNPKSTSTSRQSRL